MNFDTTYGNLKKRIFDILDEYPSSVDTVFVADTDRNVIDLRIPDAVNSALVRMYESLPIGKNVAFQRLNFMRPVYYDKTGIPEGKKTQLEFFTPVSGISLFFRFFGSGSVTLLDKGQNLVARLTCTGSESVSDMRKQFSVACAGNYIISVSGNIKIFDLAVYENDGKVSIDGLCSPDFASFGLPEDMQSAVSLCTGDRIVDESGYYTENGWGFIKKSLCEHENGVSVTYTRKPPVVCTSTESGFVFPVSPLCFEALVCLAASELCRTEDSGKYTRLIYRYNDLSEGLRNSESKIKRNSFYGISAKKRW